MKFMTSRETQELEAADLHEGRGRFAVVQTNHMHNNDVS